MIKNIIFKEDMGKYYRVTADNRDLNYDKFFVKGEVLTEADDSYTSHNMTTFSSSLTSTC